LTERLGEHFAKVIAAAHETAKLETTGGVPGNHVTALKIFFTLANSLTEWAVTPTIPSTGALEATPEWLEVIARGEKAIHVSGGTEATEVEIVTYFFTPQGLKYELKHPTPGVRWTVEAPFIQPMNGITKIVFYNPNTGEEKAKPQ
jgi:hypothetical protein